MPVLTRSISQGLAPISLDSGGARSLSRGGSRNLARSTSNLQDVGTSSRSASAAAAQFLRPKTTPASFGSTLSGRPGSTSSVGHAGTRSAYITELKDFQERFSSSFTACSLSSPPDEGHRWRVVTDGVYQSKVEMLNAWDPPTKALQHYTKGEHRAATRIQKWLRGVQMRRRFRAIVHAARVLQSRARGFQARLKTKEGKKSRKKASSVIQRSFLQHRKFCSADETAQQLRSAFPESPQVLQEVARCMKQSAPLSVLDLQHCLLGPEAAGLLTKALKKNSSIKVLDLSFCYIGDPGAEHLAGGLKFIPHLKRLALAWNCIGDEGAQHLAEAVPKFQALKELDLSYNRIGTEGAVAFATVMNTTPGLMLLALQANRISKEGAAELLKARQEWLHLQLDANNFLQRSRALRQGTRGREAGLKG